MSSSEREKRLHELEILRSMRDARGVISLLECVESSEHYMLIFSLPLPQRPLIDLVMERHGDSCVACSAAPFRARLRPISLCVAFVDRRALHESEAQVIMSDIVAAVCHLHDSNFVHRDLRLPVVYVGQGMRAVLSDFSTCERRAPEETVHGHLGR
jgi:serine/threonine protein kinase